MKEIIKKVLKEQLENDRIIRFGMLNKSKILKSNSGGTTLYFFDNETMSLVKITKPPTMSDYNNSNAGKIAFALTEKEYNRINKLIDNVKELIKLEEKKLRIFKNEYIPAAIVEIVNKNSKPSE